MDNEQRTIVTALLDKYEKSVRFTEERSVSRKVALNLCNNGKNDFPAYNIESYDIHLAYNRAAEELKKAEIVDYDWMKGQRGHLISRIWLNTERLPQAYQLASRKPKADLLHAVEAMLTGALGTAAEEWQQNYLDDCLRLVRGRRSATSLLPQEQAEMRELLRVVLAANAAGDGELLERVFSTRVLGDSKLFERKYRGWLIKLVRRYLLDGMEDITDEEALTQVGIIKYPEKVLFCGGLTATFDRGAIDFAPIPSGVAVDIETLLGVPLLMSATKILLIENKANYTSYIAHHRVDDELVIFHGGCYSPMKGRLLQKLATVISTEVAVQHWGDIDWGGFAMLSRLRCNIFPALSPYRMNEGELRRYTQGTVSITDDSYCQRLRKLLEDDRLRDCYPCICYMVEHRIRLEQEVML